MKLLSDEWKNVPSVEKKKMQTMYEKAKTAYTKKLSSIPEYELEAAKLRKANKKAEKDKREAKKELKILLESLNKPKKGLR